jgi:hypothetical protein
MKQLSSTLVLILLLHVNPAMAMPVPLELVGQHSGGMGQQGQSVKGGALCFYEHRGSLGGVKIKADGELVVSFAIGSEEFKELTFKFDNYELGATEVWHPLKDGEDRYSAALFRYGAVFRILVKLHHKDGSVAAIQWICAEPDKAEDGADQPATDTEEPTPAPPKKPLVGRWAGTGDQDNRVVVTFNSDGTYELLMVDHETPKWVKARATGRYKTDFSVSPAHLDLDMRVEEPKPEEPMTHKFEMIFEIIDENSFRMSDLTVTRPERFGNRPLVMRRQGGAGKETEPGGAGGAGRPSVSDEGSDTASVTPADPEIVPKGLEGLGLSQAQAEEFNKWLIDTGPRADPADRAKKLISILREDQLPAFQKRLHTGG